MLENKIQLFLDESKSIIQKEEELNHTIIACSMLPMTLLFFVSFIAFFVLNSFNTSSFENIINYSQESYLHLIIVNIVCFLPTAILSNTISFRESANHFSKKLRPIAKEHFLSVFVYLIPIVCFSLIVKHFARDVSAYLVLDCFLFVVSALLFLFVIWALMLRGRDNIVTYKDVIEANKKILSSKENMFDLANEIKNSHDIEELKSLLKNYENDSFEYRQIILLITTNTNKQTLT